MTTAKKILNFLIIFIASFLLPATTQAGNAEPIKIELQIPILKYTMTASMQEYFSNIYTASLYIIIPLTIVVIIIAGIQWILAGGAPNKIKESKTLIFRGFAGLGLAIFSYLILSWVGISKLSMPGVEYLEPEVMDLEFVPEEPDPSGKANYSGPGSANPKGCPQASEITKIGSNGGKILVNAGDPRLRPQTLQKLYEASDKVAAEGCKVYLSSAFRTLAHQTGLWNSAVRRYGSEQAANHWVARPSCGAPHMTGGAVDVGLVCGSQKCTPTKNCPYPALKKKLETIFNSIGWARYVTEWWHFEFGTRRWEQCKGSAC